MTLHLSTLNFKHHSSVHDTKLSRSLCNNISSLFSDIFRESDGLSHLDSSNKSLKSTPHHGEAVAKKMKIYAARAVTDCGLVAEMTIDHRPSRIEYVNQQITRPNYILSVITLHTSHLKSAIYLVCLIYLLFKSS